MKILLILAGFSLTACAQVPDFPRFPDVKKEYAFFLDQGKPTCVQFDIVSVMPYKIANAIVMPLKTCEGLGGYLPKDRLKILNWSDDVQRWTQDKTVCQKVGY